MKISDQVFRNSVTHHACSYNKNNSSNTELCCCHFSTKEDEKWRNPITIICIKVRNLLFWATSYLSKLNV